MYKDDSISQVPGSDSTPVQNSRQSKSKRLNFDFEPGPSFKPSAINIPSFNGLNKTSDTSTTLESSIPLQYLAEEKSLATTPNKHHQSCHQEFPSLSSSPVLSSNHGMSLSSSPSPHHMNIESSLHNSKFAKPVTPFKNPHTLLSSPTRINPQNASELFFTPRSSPIQPQYQPDPFLDEPPHETEHTPTQSNYRKQKSLKTLLEGIPSLDQTSYQQLINLSDDEIENFDAEQSKTKLRDSLKFIKAALEAAYKSQNEASHLKLQHQFLKIEAHEASQRYQVETNIVQREVDRLRYDHFDQQKLRLQSDASSAKGKLSKEVDKTALRKFKSYRNTGRQSHKSRIKNRDSTDFTADDDDDPSLSEDDLQIMPDTDNYDNYTKKEIDRLNSVNSQQQQQLDDYKRKLYKAKIRLKEANLELEERTQEVARLRARLREGRKQREQLEQFIINQEKSLRQVDDNSMNVSSILILDNKNQDRQTEKDKSSAINENKQNDSKDANIEYSSAYSLEQINSPSIPNNEKLQLNSPYTPQKPKHSQNKDGRKRMEDLEVLADRKSPGSSKPKNKSKHRYGDLEKESKPLIKTPTSSDNTHRDNTESIGFDDNNKNQKTRASKNLNINDLLSSPVSYPIEKRTSSQSSISSMDSVIIAKEPSIEEETHHSGSKEIQLTGSSTITSEESLKSSTNSYTIKDRDPFQPKRNSGLKSPVAFSKEQLHLQRHRPMAAPISLPSPSSIHSSLAYPQLHSFTSGSPNQLPPLQGSSSHQYPYPHQPVLHQHRTQRNSRGFLPPTPNRALQQSKVTGLGGLGLFPLSSPEKRRRRSSSMSMCEQTLREDRDEFHNHSINLPPFAQPPQSETSIQGESSAHNQGRYFMAYSQSSPDRPPGQLQYQNSGLPKMSVPVGYQQPPQQQQVTVHGYLGPSIGRHQYNPSIPSSPGPYNTYDEDLERRVEYPNERQIQPNVPYSMTPRLQSTNIPSPQSMNLPIPPQLQQRYLGSSVVSTHHTYERQQQQQQPQQQQQQQHYIQQDSVSGYSQSRSSPIVGSETLNNGPVHTARDITNQPVSMGFESTPTIDYYGNTQQHQQTAMKSPKKKQHLDHDK